MRKVYLIRHGHPDIPLGERWCLGHTDLPLAAVGRMQAALLPFVPELLKKPGYSSWLSRAVETARPLYEDSVRLIYNKWHWRIFKNSIYLEDDDD